MLKKLNRKAVAAQPARPIRILQFGEGNFLRAFVDWIIDILNEKTDFNGDVQVVQPIQQGMGAVVNEQGGLYHVVLNGITKGKPSQETRLINCVQGVINPFTDFKEYLKAAENPNLRFVVSNTTEAGITFSGSDTNPNVLPESFPGKVTVFLYHRYQFFAGAADKGLILMPCELIDKNGENLKNIILQYIGHWSLPGGFKNWILNSNTFCNTLVDRIVPGFPKDTIHDIYQATGYEDKLVVMAESFHLWVVEAPASVQKEFPTDRAGLEVKFVNELAPYRTRKVRILNGAHTSLVPVAYLNGLRTVRESMEDPKTGSFLRKAIFEEIIPTLDLPKEELEQFANDVIERFQNPYIKHELLSIALNSVSKFKVRVLPSLLKYVEIKKQLPERLVFSLAALIRFYKGQWNGEAIPVNDTADILKFFQEIWKSQSMESVARQTLANTSFWGEDLTRVDGLTQRISKHLEDMERQDINTLLSRIN